MNRREFMQNVGTTGLAASVPSLLLHSPETFAQPNPNGPLFLSLFAYGGTDASYWGDPRDTRNINSWAADGKKSVAIGGMRYAPVAENKSNFDSYHDRMLITNGVALPTKAHVPAMALMLSGRLEGANYPITSALYAAIHGVGKPLPWITVTSRRMYMLNSGNVASPTMKQPGHDIRGLIKAGGSRNKSDANVIKRFRMELARQYGEKGKRIPRVEDQLDAYLQASQSDNATERLLDSLPAAYDQGPSRSKFDRAYGDITQLMYAFAAGTTVVGQMWLDSSWDAHSGHDNAFLRQGNKITGPSQFYFNRILNHVWRKAKDLGIEDRLIVEFNTDVGSAPETPGGGKGHWTVTNHMLMGKNKPWAGRTVGVSGPYHERVAIDPKTLQPKTEADGGVYLTPAHVQMLSRQVLGIENHAIAKKFSFSNETPIDLINPKLSSPINYNGKILAEEKNWYKKPWA